MTFRPIAIFAALATMAGAEQDEAKETAKPYRVEQGTRIPLSMINSVSTKNTVEGDRVYLESVFPILSDGHVVIPAGSYVAGTVTQVKRAGRLKGRSELYVRFDSLTLPNGVTRDFRSRMGSLDGQSSSQLDRSEGKLKGEGNKGGDARTIGEAAAGGVTVGAIAGSAASRTAMGAGIGAAAGAAAGLVGVLATRGPDAMLAKGTTLEMVLDRHIEFTASETDFNGTGAARRTVTGGEGAAAPTRQRSLPLPGTGIPGRRIP